MTLSKVSSRYTKSKSFKKQDERTIFKKPVFRFREASFTLLEIQNHSIILTHNMLPVSTVRTEMGKINMEEGVAISTNFKQHTKQVRGSRNRNGSFTGQGGGKE